MRRALGFVVAGLLGLQVFASAAALLRLRVAARRRNITKTHAQTAQQAAERVSREANASVRDCGVGIVPEYHERIFAVFQSLHVREDPSSSGVGLAIVKKSIEALGGSVWVVSTKGEGNDFQLTIPKDSVCVQKEPDRASAPLA